MRDQALEQIEGRVIKRCLDMGDILRSGRNLIQEKVPGSCIAWLLVRLIAVGSGPLPNALTGLGDLFLVLACLFQP